MRISSLFKFCNYLHFGNTFVRSKHTLNAFNLKNYRSLINIQGPDAAKFLQGLITNDIYHLNSIEPKMEYSMILNNRVS